MSDENQPNEVLESQPLPEPVAADSVPPSVGDTNATQVTAELEAAAVETGPDELETVVPATETDSPSVVSIADLDAEAHRRGAGLTGSVNKLGALLQGRGWLVGVIVAVLLVVFLFLPPISLGQRLASGRGYEALSADQPSLTHPDGLTIERSADAEGVARLKLGSVPRADFLAGKPSEAEAAALAALPSHLEPKSPLYTVAVRGKDSPSATLRVVIPNEAEPWETLDLYSWDGQAWRWIPSRLDRASETIVASVAALPTSLMVVQSGLAQQTIALAASQLPGADVAAVVDQVDVPGMLIGTIGGLTGDATVLPTAAAGATMDLAPVVRNWVPGRDANPALVSDMLNLASDRATHVANLLGLAQAGGYPGVVIDYRSVLAQDRAAFAQFVNELSNTFHGAGLWVAVMVDTPQQTAEGGWETGGYDWAALGAAADQVRVMMPLSPEAYAPGGWASQMVEWATAEVERHRLMLAFSALGTDGQSTLTMQDALAPIGNIAMTETITESVEPGTVLNFTLTPAVAIEIDAVTGATQMKLGDSKVWLGTPQWLRARMDLASRYHLGGIVLHDLLDEGNMAGVVAAVADYRTNVATTAGADLPSVTWKVARDGGQATQLDTQLSQPEFVWAAPTVTGTYRIAASLAGADKGAIDVVVALPAPVITDTVATEDEEEADGVAGTASEPLTAAAGLKAAFAADVTVPDNTRFEKGEAFTKTWRLRNAGSEDWPADTVLVFSSGEKLSELAEVKVGTVKAGAEVEISVDMKAPDKDGSFKSWWTLQTGGKEIPGGKIYVQIAAGEQAATPVVVPVAGPGPTGSFELGGHVRDLGLPYKDKMHYAGMNWTKVQIRYGEGAAGVVNAAHASGFKIQLSALGSPGMVTEAGFEQKFAQWVAGLAAAGADAIEIWNEPNIEREWQIGYISPQSYTNLLCASYQAIKAANGGTAVISAAPAPTGWFGGCGPNGCDDKPWMEGMYNAGAAGCMDYIGAHHNAGATSPSARIGHPADPGSTHHSWFFLPQTELYYNIFRGTRQLFYTEMGYASQEGVPEFTGQFLWARGTDNSEQSAWLAEAVQLGINTGMVRSIIVWNIDFVRYGEDPQDGYAIIRPGGGCPACESLHAVLGTR